MTTTATKIEVYWNDTDPTNTGCAYRVRFSDGREESGPWDWDIPRRDAVVELAKQHGIGITPEDVAYEPDVEGGHAVWQAADIKQHVWNLTPHPITYDDGSTTRTLPSEGNLRVEQRSKLAGPVDGMDTVRTEYGGLIGMPATVRNGDVVIVSTIAADEMLRKHMISQGTYDLGDGRECALIVLVPDTGPTAKRDDFGVVSVSQFIRKG